MKASEVLRRYQAGERNFQRVNLRSQSFKGQDLLEAEFSGAESRSPNFSVATLQGAKFCGVKCGRAIRPRMAIYDYVKNFFFSLLFSAYWSLNNQRK